MYLNNIDSGTVFNITMEDGMKLTGEHDGNIDHMNFHLYCPEISKNIEELTGVVITVEGESKGGAYTFTAEVLGKSERTTWGREAIDMVIKTPIKVTPRRETFRVEFRIKVKIYLYDAESKDTMFRGDLMCESITEDISKGGARIWSDFAIDKPKETLFLLEFGSPLRGAYMLPAKLMRNQQNTATRAYNYDFGFAFDFTNMPEQQDKFIIDVVETKLKGEGRLA